MRKARGSEERGDDRKKMKQEKKKKNEENERERSVTRYKSNYLTQNEKNPDSKRTKAKQMRKYWVKRRRVGGGGQG